MVNVERSHIVFTAIMAGLVIFLLLGSSGQTIVISKTINATTNASVNITVPPTNMLPASNITNGTFGSNFGDTGNYRFPKNVTIDGFLNVSGVGGNSTIKGDLQINGTIYGGSPVKISGGIRVFGNGVFDDISVDSCTGCAIINGTTINATNITAINGFFNYVNVTTVLNATTILSNYIITKNLNVTENFTAPNITASDRLSIRSKVSNTTAVFSYTSGGLLTLNQTSGSGFLYFMPNAVNAQISAGNFTGAGMFFIDMRNKRPICLNCLQTGLVETGGNLSVDGRLGVATTIPNYPLEVNANVSGISIYSSSNVSATGYITRTDVYDMSRGNALSNIQNATFYKRNGNIDHSTFGYSYVSYTILVPNATKVTINPETNLSEVSVLSYKNITQEGVDLGKEVALLKQAIYELKARTDCLVNTPDLLETRC